MAVQPYYFDPTPYEKLPLSEDQRMLLDTFKSAPYGPNSPFRTTHARTLAGALFGVTQFSPDSVPAAMSKFRLVFREPHIREAASRVYAQYNGRRERKQDKRTRITEEDLKAAGRNGVRPLIEMLMGLNPGVGGKDMRSSFLIVCKAIAAATKPKSARRTDHHWRNFTSVVMRSDRAVDILNAFHDAVNEGRIQPEHYGFKLKLAMTGSLALAVEARLKR